MQSGRWVGRLKDERRKSGLNWGEVLSRVPAAVVTQLSGQKDRATRKGVRELKLGALCGAICTARRMAKQHWAAWHLYKVMRALSETFARKPGYWLDTSASDSGIIIF